MDDCCLDRDSRFDRLPRKIAATQAWSRNPPDSISGTVVPRSTLSGKQSLEIRHVHHSSHRSCSAADRRRSNLASQSKLGLRSFRPAGPGARGGPGDGAREPDAHLTSSHLTRSTCHVLPISRSRQSQRCRIPIRTTCQSRTRRLQELSDRTFPSKIPRGCPSRHPERTRAFMRAVLKIALLDSAVGL